MSSHAPGDMKDAVMEVHIIGFKWSSVCTSFRVYPSFYDRVHTTYFVMEYVRHLFVYTTFYVIECIPYFLLWTKYHIFCDWVYSIFCDGALFHIICNVVYTCYIFQWSIYCISQWSICNIFTME
jgi:hypothetical protein